MRLIQLITALVLLFSPVLLLPFPAAKAQDSATLPEVETDRMFRPGIEPFTIRYEGEDFLITEETHQRLVRLAGRLRGTQDKIRLTAHSGNAQLSTHEAVKLSFLRAVYIRIFLLENGVEAEQILLEALPQPGDGPSNIVRIAPVER